MHCQNKVWLKTAQIIFYDLGSAFFKVTECLHTRPAVGRTMVAQEDQVLIQGICICGTLHGKGEIKNADGTEVSNQLTWNFLISPVSSMSSQYTQKYKKRGRKVGVRRRCETLPVIFVLEEGIQLRAKEWRQLLEAAKDKETDSLPDPSARNSSVNILILSQWETLTTFNHHSYNKK